MKLIFKIIQSHLYSFIVVVTIGTVMAGLWINSLKSANILCSADCGEVFDALQYVSNYNLYGFKYRLVQDMATSSTLTSHPYFYTHNVNLAGYFFTFLEAVGVKPLFLKQFFTLVIFALGLFYIYKTISFYTSSRLAGLVTLLFFSTDYEHVLVFGLNSLRAWHWLALFGLIFHFKSILLSSNKNIRWPIVDYLLFAGFAIISFGLGYDFWIICIFIIFWLMFFFLKRPFFSPENILIVFTIGLIFLFPFVLRQIQIISGLGLQFWAKDLYYSAAIKVSFLNHVFPITSIEQVDKFYRLYNVQRPPAFQSQSLRQNLTTLKDMLVNITIPTYGIVSAILSLFLCLYSVFVGAILVFNANKKHVLDSYSFQLEPVIFDINNAVKLLAGIFLGIVLGLGFFAPLSFHIYFKHQFPLIAILLILPKAFVVTIGLQLLFLRYKFPFQKTIKSIAIAGMVIALMGDHILIQHDNYIAKRPIDVSWINTVKNMPGETLAVSWIPSSASVFTSTWAVGVSRGKEVGAFDRLNNGLPPFQIEDYFLFGERGAEEKYLHPSYWLYFPTEQMSSFDSPVPVCRQDYVVNFFQQIFPLPDPKPIPLRNVTPQSVQPGGQVLFVGNIEGKYKGLEHIYVFNNNNLLGELLYNCIYNQYVGILQMPQNAIEGKYDVTVRADYANHEQFIVSETNITISKTAASDYVLPSINVPQMGVDEIISKYPNIKIYKRGSDFVIFDLRN